MRDSNQILKHEEKVWSQNGEDGVIRAIFNTLGVTNRFYVEFGVGDASECNTRLLSENGWNGLWMDSSAESGDKVMRAFIDADNIVDLLVNNHVPRIFDLLSIDLDSNDFWVFEKLSTAFQPRVIVVEYNASYPPPAAVTVQYDPDLRWSGTDYFGASLSAWYQLMGARGYSLIGCDSRGVNAFFLRDSLTCDMFTTLSDVEAYVPPNYGRYVEGKFLGHPKDVRRLVSIAQDE